LIVGDGSTWQGRRCGFTDASGSIADLHAVVSRHFN
jgi:hypothetical protein